MQIKIKNQKIKYEKLTLNTKEQIQSHPISGTIVNRPDFLHGAHKW